MFCFSSKQIVFAIGEISNTIIDPLLDISIFSPYKIKSTITGSPTSVSVDISGINGNLTNNENWNYYVDGTPDSDIRTKTMTYDIGEDMWISENIYPDDIYPEIFFAPSSITWNNAPSSTIIRRSNYHIMHFQNPLTMAASSSFFIELNALARASNSQALSVYLIGNGEDISYFSSDWRNKASTELVGTIFNSDSFHHTHTANSAHRLIPLFTNANGRIGTKNLNIDGDFWIVLYSNAPNNNLGWDFRYQNENLCTNNAEWYIGNSTRWVTMHKTGCPDAHVHIARRGPTYIDGARAVVTANYDGEGRPRCSTTTFSFGDLPNITPNPSSFISPISNGVYSGDQLLIQWATSTDPNGDPLTYNVYVSDGVSTTTLVSTTTNQSFNWDISGVNNGSYSLSGEVCDASLCTNFNLIDTFTIERSSLIYSISNISISSNNASSTLAKTSDIITLTFSATGDVSSTLNIEPYPGGVTSTGISNLSHVGNNWTLTYTVGPEDADGYFDFIISADNLDLQYFQTTDNSYVVVDVTNPENVIASPDAGNYSFAQNIELLSSNSSYIRYLTNGSNPTCSSGNLYNSTISINSPTTIKAIACDYAGNYSDVSTFVYNFFYTLDYIANSGGTISGSSTQTIEYAGNGAEVSAVSSTGYLFSSWSDGLLSATRTDTNIVANLTVYANFSGATNTINYIAGSGGSISGSSTQVINYGENATPVTAVPDTGYHFTSWSDGILTTSRTDTNIISGETFTANFAINTYTFTYLAGAHGSISGSSTQVINYGENATPVTAVPDTGYHFTSWSDGILTTSRTDLSASSNTTITANFAINTYMLNYSTTVGGSIGGSSTQLINHGSSGATVTAIPNTGYYFTSWNDGVLTSSRTDTNIISDKTLIANIQQDITAPIITILGSNPISIYKDALYSDAGATANDVIDGDLTNSIVVSNDVNTSVVGSYSVTYVVSDAGGNTSTAIRTVDVIPRLGGGIPINILQRQNSENQQNNIQSSNFWTSGTWVKTSDSKTVYFLDSNNVRHAYPNQNIWKSYFGNDFSFVKVISKEQIASYQLDKNVPYKTNSLFKISSIPKVYRVGENSIIQWIVSESVARKLYGDSWNKIVEDLPDAFFGDYILGSDIE